MLHMTCMIDGWKLGKDAQEQVSNCSYSRAESLHTCRYLGLKGAAIEGQHEGLWTVKPVRCGLQLQFIFSLKLLCLHICILHDKVTLSALAGVCAPQQALCMQYRVHTGTCVDLKRACNSWIIQKEDAKKIPGESGKALTMTTLRCHNSGIRS